MINSLSCHICEQKEIDSQRKKAHVFQSSDKKNRNFVHARSTWIHILLLLTSSQEDSFNSFRIIHASADLWWFHFASVNIKFRNLGYIGLLKWLVKHRNNWPITHEATIYKYVQSYWHSVRIHHPCWCIKFWRRLAEIANNLPIGSFNAGVNNIFLGLEWPQLATVPDKSHANDRISIPFCFCYCLFVFSANAQ